MNTIFIGMDISTTFSGITTYSVKDGYNYYAVLHTPPKPKTKDINYKRIEHHKVNYHYFDNDKDVNVAFDNYLIQLNNLWDKITKGFEEIRVGIEHFAFSAKGNNNVKLYCFVIGVRRFIHGKGLKYNEHIIQSVKKFFTGNGRAGKGDMVREFIKKDTSLFNNVEFLLNDSGEYVKTQTQRLKLDDIADSRAICDMEIGIFEGTYKKPVKKNKPKSNKKREIIKKEKEFISELFTKYEDDLLM